MLPACSEASGTNELAARSTGARLGTRAVFTFPFAPEAPEFWLNLIHMGRTAQLPQNWGPGGEFTKVVITDDPLIRDSREFLSNSPRKYPYEQ